MPTRTSEEDGNLPPAISQKWIDIQEGTFTQWINQHLDDSDHHIEVLHEDLCNGVKLVKLLESLQSRKLGRVFANPITDIQKIENVNRAFRALSDKGIRLVNIGPEDIVEGNQKLILGLVWQLILCYQIGSSQDPTSKMQPKKRMLAWLQAALPKHNPNNFTSHWNDGQSLLSLIDYCQPGIVEERWRQHLGPDDGQKRCQFGLDAAEKDLKIPSLLTAESLNSARLDELSGMTYLSYFLNIDSPGYNSTLAWVNSTLKPSKPVNDFKESWKDGVLMCQLLTALGYQVPGWPDPLMRSSSTERIRAALSAASNQLGAKFDFGPSDIEVADPHHLIAMTYATRLRMAGPAPVGNGHAAPELELISKTKKNEGSLSCPNADEISIGDKVSCSLMFEEPVSRTSGVEFRVSGPNGLEVLPPGAIQWDASNRRANFTFGATQVGQHTVQAVGPNLRVPPMRVSVRDDDVRVNLPSSWESGTEKQIDVEASAGNAHALTAVWRDPDGQRHNLALERDFRTGKMRLRAKPDRPGTYELFVTCNGRNVNGSPFSLTVHDGDRDRNSSHSSSSSSSSSSHSYSMVRKVSSSRQPMQTVKESVSVWTKDPVEFGKESNLTVQLGKNSGEVTAQVTRNGRVIPSTLTERDSNHTQSVRFMPDEPGDYRVSVYHGGQEVADTVFNVQPNLDPSTVHCSGSNLQLAETNSNSSFQIHSPVKAVREKLNVKLTAPKGNNVNTTLRHHTEHSEVGFRTRDAGEHRLDVQLAGSHVTGSPFNVYSYDSSSVRVDMDPRVKAGENTEVTVFAADDDRVPIECFLQSPSGQQQQLQRISSGSKGQHRFAYQAKEPGRHHLSVRYGGRDLPGSPFLQTVAVEERQEEPMTPPKVGGLGLERAQVGAASEFFVDAKGRKGDLSVQVDGPDAVSKCNIEPDVAGRYRVTYVPQTVGHYTAKVSWNNQPLPNSPFRPIVVDPGALRCSDLRSTDQPLEPLVVGRKKELVFTSSNAGPGALKASVVDATGKSVGARVRKRSDDQLAVSFTPERSGLHKLRLQWSDFEVAGSPFFGMATVDQTLGHTKIILSGRGLKEARVNEESEFIIDAKHAGPGAPIVHMKGTRTEQPVEIDSIMDRRYRCTYTPRVPGAYLLTIWWSERQLKGSPFKVSVVAPSDASKVACSGDGLSHGVLDGDPMECFIDTQRAGPGELTAHCSGPTKVAYCELYDRRDGTYVLKIRPQETGRHVLQVKFDGDHVLGSPFISRVSHAPDASKVRVSGPGVECGLLSSFQSRFLVETRGAGAGQLTVRVRGPRGGFRVEMERETRTDRTILCRYDPTEVGEYSINVAWSGVQVPGSPFRVMLCHSESELANYCRQHNLQMPDRGQWRAQL